MPRRRNRDADWAELIAGVAGLLMFLAFISPQVRQTVYTLGLIGLCVFGLAVVALIGFAIYRYKTRSQRAASSDTFILSSITRANAPPVTIPRTRSACRCGGAGIGGITGMPWQAK